VPIRVSGWNRQALIMSGAAILFAGVDRCWPTDRLSVADVVCAGRYNAQMNKKKKKKKKTRMAFGRRIRLNGEKLRQARRRTGGASGGKKPPRQEIHQGAANVISKVKVKSGARVAS